MQPFVEEIIHENIVHAIIIDKNWNPNKTEFITSPNLNFQLGAICYKANESIIPHRHLNYERKINGTSECLFVKKGKCYIDLYDKNNHIFLSKILDEGAIILLFGGAHGFRMIEDTTLVEVKQGPFADELDKKRFY